MTTQQTELEQTTGPGSAAPPAAQPASVVPPEKKPRKPSKKVQALIDAAHERGVNSGINSAKEQPTGFWIWLAAALVVGFIARGYV